MKKNYLVIVVFALFVFANVANAKVIRVNNNLTTISGILYNDLLSAYNFASAGDTLLVEGSATEYGDLAISKKIVIFGPGYHLDLNPKTQVTKLMAKLGALTFSGTSSGSLVSGCFLNKITTITVNNVTISRNYYYVPYNVGHTISVNSGIDVVIEQNLIWGSIGNNPSAGTPKMMIRNNIVGLISLAVNAEAIIMNNFFDWRVYYAVGGGAIPAQLNVHNSTVMNNMFNVYQAGLIVLEAANNNSFSNNIFMGIPEPANAPANNLWNKTNLDFLTIALPADNTNFDNRYLLMEGTQASTFGHDGKPVGIQGGDRPYVLSGLPPIPHIYKFEADPAGTTEIKVKISVQSQN